MNRGGALGGRVPRALVFAAASLAVAGCPPSNTEGTGGSAPCAEPTGASAWQVVLDEGDLDRAVLSTWGTAPNDVYAVGGPLGNGQASLALHFDGCAWSELAPGGTETYWWVSGSGPHDVWMVGEHGRTTHFDGAHFDEHTSGVNATLWGVIAFAPNDAFAVGGTPGTEPGDDDVLLHWDGTAWKAPANRPAPKGAAFYKIWGTGADNLYVVGEFGIIWHLHGGTWTLESDPPIAQGTLFTVTGCSATEVYAVGGNDVLRSNGTSWTKLDVTLNSTVSGVACNRPGDVVIVGNGGLKQRLVDGAWIDDFKIQPWNDLHGAWADGQGTFWAVGGDFANPPKAGAPRVGIVARWGPGTVADSITH